MKKLLASMFMAGLLITGSIGCSGTATTGSASSPVDPKVKAKADAKKLMDDAKAALDKETDAEKKKTLQKAYDDAKSAYDKLP